MPANGRNPAYRPSEASQVVLKFGDFDAQSQQDVLNFFPSALKPGDR
jgi:hypothetical protein